VNSVNTTHFKKAILVFSSIVCILFLSFYITSEILAETYEDGKITVRHRELSIKKNRGNIRFSHPYEMTADVVRNVLSQIYFKEKGLLKKDESVHVFQDDEIGKLMPLIIQAFSVATPTQGVEVVSYSERPFFGDKQNYCIMFVNENRLNIVFSRIHKFQTYSDLMAEKKGSGAAKEDPTKIKGSRFWTLLPSYGQAFEPGHKNWLVVNISDEAYQKPEKRNSNIAWEGGDDSYNQPQRSGRFERNVGGSSGYQQMTSQANIAQRESKIKSKLLILRELVNDGILLREDYDYKKTMLLKNGMNDMEIKDQFREIKDLLEEGLITEEDHNKKKKELLDLF